MGTWIRVGACVCNAVEIEALRATVEGELAWMARFVFDRRKELELRAVCGSIFSRLKPAFLLV